MHTDITVVLDRSGSMVNIKTESEMGFKDFIEEQRKVPGDAALSLYQFDDHFDKVIDCKDIKDVDSVNIEPRGSTALFDAVGTAIIETDRRLSDLAVPPDKVLFIVITDGFENASREFSREQIVQLLEKFNRKWQFVYLGADQDALLTGQEMGFKQQDCLSYQSTGKSVDATYSVLSRATTRYRVEGLSSGFYLPEEQRQ